MFHETHNLAGYIEGTLDAQAAARVERHLERCAHCRAALADMRAAKHTLTALGEDIRPVHYDSELWGRVRAQIVTPHRAAPPRPRWALAGGGFALSAAAVCLAVLMNMQGTGVHHGAVPTLSVVPNETQKSVTPSVAPKQSTSQHASADRHGRESTPVSRPSENPSGAGAKAPVPATAPPALPGAVVAHDAAAVPGPAVAVKPEASSLSAAPAAGTMIAKSDNGALNYQYGAAGNIQGNRRSISGTDSKVKERATFSTKNAVRLDAQNVPSLTGQTAPPSGATPLADKDAHRPVGGALTPVASPAPASEGLDIVSDSAPRYRKPVGLAGDIGERAMMAKVQPAPPPSAIGGSMDHLRIAEPRTGVSTVEGHRLYSEADRAYVAGKDSSASVYYTEAIKQGLDSVERRASEVRLGDLAMKANDAVTAVRWYRAAARGSRNAEILTKLGDALEKSGDAKGATDAFRQALAANPDCADAKTGLERVKGK